MMKKRWLVYLLVGVMFGIADFYYQIFATRTFAAQLSNLAVWAVLILGIWLVVVIPVAWYEARAARSMWRAALAGVFTWSTAVVAYYLFLGVKLVLIGEPSRPEMHITQSQSPYYASNLKAFLLGDFWSGVSEWIVVALVGGFLVGLLVGFLTLRFGRR